MPTKLTSEDIECLADESEDDVSVPYDEIKHVTKKAVLIKTSGEKVWLPFSQIVAHDEDEFVITEYIAQAKNLV